MRKYLIKINAQAYKWGYRIISIHQPTLIRDIEAIIEIDSIAQLEAIAGITKSSLIVDYNYDMVLPDPNAIPQITIYDYYVE